MLQTFGYPGNESQFCGWVCVSGKYKNMRTKERLLRSKPSVVWMQNNQPFFFTIRALLFNSIGTCLNYIGFIEKGQSCNALKMYEDAVDTKLIPLLPSFGLIGPSTLF